MLAAGLIGENFGLAGLSEMMTILGRGFESLGNAIARLACAIEERIEKLGAPLVSRLVENSVKPLLGYVNGFCCGVCGIDERLARGVCRATGNMSPSRCR
ncbi:MAG: hypothetical protein ACKO1J_12995 [Tagaea sp.]